MKKIVVMMMILVSCASYSWEKSETDGIKNFYCESDSKISTLVVTIADNNGREERFISLDARDFEEMPDQIFVIAFIDSEYIGDIAFCNNGNKLYMAKLKNKLLGKMFDGYNMQLVISDEAYSYVKKENYLIYGLKENMR